MCRVCWYSLLHSQITLRKAVSFYTSTSINLWYTQFVLKREHMSSFSYWSFPLIFASFRFYEGCRVWHLPRHRDPRAPLYNGARVFCLWKAADQPLAAQDQHRLLSPSQPTPDAPVCGPGLTSHRVLPDHPARWEQAPAQPQRQHLFNVCASTCPRRPWGPYQSATTTSTSTASTSGWAWTRVAPCAGKRRSPHLSLRPCLHCPRHP